MQHHAGLSCGIPRILHQIWFQGEVDIPSRYIPFQKNWKELHSDFTYVLWDEIRISELLKKHHPKFYAIWKNLPHRIQKIDAAKIVILCDFGGVYVDMDMEPIMSIEPMLSAPLVLSRCYVHPIAKVLSGVIGLPYFSQTAINNGFIACQAQHPVMRRAMLIMRKHTALLPRAMAFGVYIAKTCGTEVIIRALSEHLVEHPKTRFRVYPSEFFEPKVKIRGREPLVSKHTRVIHHSDRSWLKDSPIPIVQWTVLISVCAVILTCVVLFSVFGCRKLMAILQSKEPKS